MRFLVGIGSSEFLELCNAGKHRVCGSIVGGEDSCDHSSRDCVLGFRLDLTKKARGTDLCMFCSMGSIFSGGSSALHDRSVFRVMSFFNMISDPELSATFFRRLESFLFH